MSSILFPSKTFLLGEYSVLKGGDALVLAHGPHFSANIRSIPNESKAFHEESPAGRLASLHGIDTRLLDFQDPHQGRGGFGGSGAEFLSVCKMLKDCPNDPTAFAWFARNQYIQLKLPGSGADLLTQAFLANSPFSGLVHINLKDQSLRKIPLRSLQVELHLFHTGKKLATHSHLSEKKEPPYSALASLTQAALEAFEKKESGRLIRSISEYGETLKFAGLLAPHSRLALEDPALCVPNVLSAKGCGAMGSDVLLVATKIGGADLTPWRNAHSLVEVMSITI